MPLTEAGIYYADTSTNMSIADITAAMATSVGGALTVLQVAQTTKNTVFSSSTVSYVDVTGLSVTITPKYSTSKILVTANFLQSNNNASNANWFKMVRNNIDIGNTANGLMVTPYLATTASSWIALSYLDSPASTSATTYKIQMSLSGASTGYVGTYSANPAIASLSTITVMEIAG